MPDLLIVITDLWLIWFFKRMWYWIKISGLNCLRLLRVLVFPEKGKCIETRDDDQQRSDWLAERQQRNDIISLKKDT